jgi:uncharacterized protein YbjT (DUF2867 family)
MSGERRVLITGATGKQGGALAQAIEGKGFRVYAMTRRPESEAAKALVARGVDVLQGDFDDPASLKRALAGMWGVFAMQNTWEAGVEKEEEQGKRLATLAREAGVHHYVYTSVGSAHRETGIPHFDNKSRIEDTVRALRFPSHVILRPVFFMENLLTPWFLHGDNLLAALAPEVSLQMIAVDDVGRFAAEVFLQADRFRGREIDLAGDAATMPETATLLSRGLGRPITFVRIPIEEVRKNSEDYAIMLEWFERVGYDADIAGIEREFGFRTTKLAEWAATRRL